MNTTAHQRANLAAWTLLKLAEKPEGDWPEILKDIRDTLVDFRALEARCAWQAGMLERAKERMETYHSSGFDEWLADLERGMVDE